MDSDILWFTVKHLFVAIIVIPVMVTGLMLLTGATTIDRVIDVYGLEFLIDGGTNEG